MRKFFYSLLLTIVLVSVAASAQAQEPWPGLVKRKLKFTGMNFSQFPQGMKEWTKTQDLNKDYENGGAFVCRIDLNDDGVPEIFVDNGNGGTGGPGYSILQKAGNSYREIGALQGGLSLLQSVHGYYQIQAWSRAGGGQFTRTLHRFRSGRYHLVRIEDYRDLEGIRQYVGSRDPVEYDH